MTVLFSKCSVLALSSCHHNHEKSTVTTLWTELKQRLLDPSHVNGMAKVQCTENVRCLSKKDHSSVINLSSAGLDSWGFIYFSFIASSFFSSLSLSFLSSHCTQWTTTIDKETNLLFIDSAFILIFNGHGILLNGKVIVTKLLFCLLICVILTLHYVAFWTHVSIYSWPST